MRLPISTDDGWPASRLMKGGMIKLSDLRKQAGEPIAQLADRAISMYFRMLREGAQERTDVPFGD